MKKPTKLLIPTDASEHFCKTLYLPKGHPIFGVYENAIESLIESLEEDEDDELSTIESQLEFISQHMSHEIAGNYENDLGFAESIIDMEIVKPKKSIKAA
jgi:hypothetical protein